MKFMRKHNQVHMAGSPYTCICPSRAAWGSKAILLFQWKAIAEQYKLGAIERKYFAILLYVPTLIDNM